MSTALRREEENNFEAEPTETAKIVRLETATETIMAYVGYLTNEILAEEDQEQPNSQRIRALRDQKQVLLSERKAIAPDDETLIAKALYVYAPIMKALDKNG